MDRNFLYGIATFLAIALFGVYIQNNHPNFFSEITGEKETEDSWKEEAPILEQDETLPKEVTPPEIKVNPDATSPETEPSDPESDEPEINSPEQHQNRRLRRHNRDRHVNLSRSPNLFGDVI